MVAVQLSVLRHLTVVWPVKVREGLAHANEVLHLSLDAVEAKQMAFCALPCVTVRSVCETTAALDGEIGFVVERQVNEHFGMCDKCCLEGYRE